MIAASLSVQRPANAKLLVADRRGRVEHWLRSDFVRLFQAGDLVIANDAATLPASLSGRHVPSGRRIEVRLAGRDSLSADAVKQMSAVLFGLGDFRMATEHRPPPPSVHPGDRLALGPLRATIIRHLMNHPRFVALEFDGSPHEIWAGLAQHGRPIQVPRICRRRWRFGIRGHPSRVCRPRSNPPPPVLSWTGMLSHPCERGELASSRSPTLRAFLQLGILRWMRGCPLMNRTA